MSIAQKSLEFSGLYEVELLVELMLRHWGHPHAGDAAFRNALLETAVEILRLAVSGKNVIDGLKPDKMNLVAAVWYAESNWIGDAHDDPPQVLKKRKAWTEKVRRAIPSCFCDPDLLS